MLVLLIMLINAASCIVTPTLHLLLLLINVASCGIMRTRHHHDATIALSAPRFSLQLQPPVAPPGCFAR